MRITFIDFETQGDDPATTNPTEVGIIECDRERLNNLPDLYTKVGELSTLIYDEKYPAQTDEIIEITGITDEMLKKDGNDPKTVFETISLSIKNSDYVLAHNAKFDRGVYEATCTRLGLPVAQPKKGWICTIEDIPWAKKYRCKQLAHLAFDHGVQFNKDDLHRALDDVKLLSKLVLHFSHMNFDEILAYWGMPWVFLFLNGVKAPWQDGGVSNAFAKKLQFGWQKAPRTDAPEFEKRWVKRVKENKVDEEKAKLVGTDYRLTKQVLVQNETRNEISNEPSGPVSQDAPPI